MAENLDKKLKGYIKIAIKQGYSKEQIKNSLLKVGYDMGVIDKTIIDLSKEKTLKKGLLVFLIITIVVGLFIISHYFKKSIEKESLIFYAEQPIEIFLQSNKLILLMNWALPTESKQNELINLTTIWKSQKEVTYNYGTELSIIDKEGNTLVKYFFNNNSYPTSLRREGYRYLETYRFNVPYLKPDTYYYKIGLWDSSSKRFFYSYDGTILGNITIKKNSGLFPCGLIISQIRRNSPASNLGITRNEKIISINEEPVELRDDIYETVNLLRNKLSKEKTLVIKTDKATYTIQNSNVTFDIYKSLGILFDFELCKK